MYCTFMLRALGYSDTQENADFTFDQVLTFAQQVGIYSNVLFSAESFLRDDLSAITLETLAADEKGENICLLKQLSDSGAVDSMIAEPILARFDAAEKGLSAISSYQTQTKLSLNFEDSNEFNTYDTEGTLLDASAFINFGNIQMDLSDSENVKAAYTETQSSGSSVKSQSSAWYCDGWLYTDTNGIQEKVQVPSFSSGLLPSDISGDTYLAIAKQYFIDSATVETTESGTQYHYDMSDAYNMLIGSVLGYLFGEQYENEESYTNATNNKVNCSLSLFVAPDGTLKQQKIEIQATIDVAGITCLSINTSRTATLVAEGDAVTISFPDFSDYKETIKD